MVATNGTAETSELEGIVARVNERGVLLEGRLNWYNVSRYAAGGVLLPEVGARVRLGLDKAGFIRTIALIDEPPAVAPRVDTSPVTPAAIASSEPPDRDTRIMRQAVLNTATAILASGGRATDLASVLAVAEALEAWVLR